MFISVLPKLGRRVPGLVALALLVGSLALSGCRFTNLQEPVARTATPDSLSNLSTPIPRTATPAVIANSDPYCGSHRRHNDPYPSYTHGRDDERR